jgi:uncharacterized protein with GYD domain
MPTYATLFKYTQKGFENIKDHPKRLDAVRKAITAAGGKLIGLYLTMGQYDLLAICEFPDDETAARTLLGAGSQGYVRSETLRAFTEDEYRQLVAGIP